MLQFSRGIQRRPERCVIYGHEGIGKTTLGSMMPEPVFIDLENSSDHLDVQRTPKPGSWTMLLSVVDDLIQNNYGFQTVVIDTLDKAQELCQQHVCAVGQLESLEDFGYGAGYAKSYEEFGKFLNKLTDLSGKIHVVCLAHSMINKFERPDESGSYDRFEMKLQVGRKSNIAGLVKEWGTMVLFADYETIVVHEKDGAKEKARATGGAHCIRTRHHPCWDAKNRHSLPAKIRWIEGQFPKELAPIFFGQNPQPVQQTAQQPVKQPTQQQQFDQEMKQLKQNQPVQAPQVTPPAQVQTDETAFNADLYQLMEKDGITEQELEAVVAARGIFPEGTSCHVYPDEFVKGWCIPFWNKIVEFVHNNIRKGAA